MITSLGRNGLVGGGFAFVEEFGDVEGKNDAVAARLLAKDRLKGNVRVVVKHRMEEMGWLSIYREER